MFLYPPTCSQVVAIVTFHSDHGSHRTHLWLSIVLQISLYCGKVLGDPALSDLCFPCQLHTDRYCSHCFCWTRTSVPVYTVFFPPQKLGSQLRNQFLREDCWFQDWVSLFHLIVQCFSFIFLTLEFKKKKKPARSFLVFNHVLHLYGLKLLLKIQVTKCITSRINPNVNYGL